MTQFQVSVNPTLWTRTSTPRSVAEAALQLAGTPKTKPAFESAIRAALDAVRGLTPDQLAALGDVEQRDDATWVRTDVGALVIDAESVEFYPPDWLDG